MIKTVAAEWKALSLITGTVLYSRRIVGLSFLKFFRFLEIEIATFRGKKIEQLRVWVVGRRIPIGGAAETGADPSALGSRYHTGDQGAALLVDSLRPIQLFDERDGREKLAIRAIENVEKTIAVGFGKKFTRLACVNSVD